MCDAAGEVVARAEAFVEQVLVVDVVPGPERPVTLAVTPVTPAVTPRAPLPVAPAVRDLSHEAEVWEAVVLGTRDYVTKNGFGGVVLGLSGGVDSSLVAAIAVDALGADKVHGVLMPSRYSSDHSVTDAERLADALGIDHRTIAIEAAHAGMLGMLAESFEGREPDLTEENLQSRIRGMVLMSLSNKFGWLVLTTSNKSESAVGYATLFGDTAGGFAVIKDVPKLLVYDLARYRNGVAGRELIPEAVLTKPPSAELRPDQRDDQSLPPYPVLDPILELYVEDDRSVAEIVAAGHDRETVERIVRLVDRAEYKRRLTPRPQADHQGLRPGPSPPHHQPLSRLTPRPAAAVPARVGGRPTGRPVRAARRDRGPGRGVSPGPHAWQGSGMVSAPWVLTSQ